jgi:DMSO/TMAO reductase YedYZ heme-binding membrane subunit
LDEHVWWYLSRGSGLVAWTTLTASMSFGLVLSTRLFGRGVAPAWLLDLHRFLGALAILLTAVHAGALVADGYVQFSIADITLPFAANWKPGAVAWGIAAMWCMLAIEVTSLLMRRLPRSWWRAIHTTSFATFVAVAVHAARAGTDRSEGLVQLGALSAVMTVMFLTFVRILAERGARRSVAT